jgi:uncharacterized membrane protein YkvA (DUF1232 family)
MESIKRFFKDNWLLVVAIIYLIIPVDLLPDIIPVLGKLDDSSIMVIELIKRYLDSKKK